MNVSVTAFYSLARTVNFVLRSDIRSIISPVIVQPEKRRASGKLGKESVSIARDNHFISRVCHNGPQPTLHLLSLTTS